MSGTEDRSTDAESPGEKNPVVQLVSASDGEQRLERQHAVAKCSDLLVRRELMRRVSHPSGGEAHKPFHELRCRSRPGGFVQERGGWGGSSGDVFPSGDGVGVASPASKMVSIRLHSVSGSFCLTREPCGPFKARSIT